MRRGLPLSAIVLAAVALGACDPCFAVVGCEGSPRVAVNGRVLVGETGAPVVNASITLLGAVGGDLDSVVTRTDRSGLFRAALFRVTGAKVSLRVAPEGFPGYTIDSLPCAPVTIGGDACVLDPILPAPWVPIHAQINYRYSRELVIGRQVIFNRTGGSTWFGPNASESIASKTDSSGIANLFPVGLYTTSLDPVLGDLVVSLPEPYGTSIRHGYVVRPVYLFNEKPLDVFGVGPSLDYRMVFVDSATQRPVPGVFVRFERTSGIPTDPELIEGTSDENGRVSLPQRPLASGTLNGKLIVRAHPSGAVTTIPEFTLSTFDGDSSIVAARWAVGNTGVLYSIASKLP